MFVGVGRWVNANLGMLCRKIATTTKKKMSLSMHNVKPRTTEESKEHLPGGLLLPPPPVCQNMYFKWLSRHFYTCVHVPILPSLIAFASTASIFESRVAPLNWWDDHEVIRVIIHSRACAFSSDGLVMHVLSVVGCTDLNFGRQKVHTLCFDVQVGFRILQDAKWNCSETAVAIQYTK